METDRIPILIYHSTAGLPLSSAKHLDDVLDAFKGVLTQLAKLNDHDFVHRDVSYANIFIREFQTGADTGNTPVVGWLNDLTSRYNMRRSRTNFVQSHIHFHHKHETSTGEGSGRNFSSSEEPGTKEPRSKKQRATAGDLSSTIQGNKSIRQDIPYPLQRWSDETNALNAKLRLLDNLESDDVDVFTDRLKQRLVNDEAWDREHVVQLLWELTQPLQLPMADVERRRNWATLFPDGCNKKEVVKNIVRKMVHALERGKKRFNGEL
ncbi:hypothetical protein BT69DRAFT_1348710 [Atractiella rhizophila]|nr:hypothetical protein BT69DRAFT_1348710 [Atractiella rhizophila]